MSWALAWVAARLVVWHGLRWGLADVPNERSSHASPVPKGGGFGIPLVAGIAGVLFAPARLWIICPALFVSLIAFYNDRKELSPGIRLLAEAIAACNRQGKYIGICGQGPSDHPDLADWLVEQGIGSISLNPDTVVTTWRRLAQA